MTQGMSTLGMQELRVKIITPQLFPDGEEFMRFVVDYITESKRRSLSLPGAHVRMVDYD